MSTGGPYHPHMTMAYGTPATPYEPGPTPRTVPQIEIDPSTFLTGGPPPKRKVTTAARVDAEGRLHLRISVDGVHIREVTTDGTNVTIEEEL